jgi:hypothetical protein
MEGRWVLYFVAFHKECQDVANCGFVCDFDASSPTRILRTKTVEGAYKYHDLEDAWLAGLGYQRVCPAMFYVISTTDGKWAPVIDAPAPTEAELELHPVCSEHALRSALAECA